jgi:hypothetical protein
MVAAALKLVGVDLQRQWLRLKADAEDYTHRATDEMRRSAINVGVAIGLALAGMMFAMLTILVGLAALYRWVAIEHGPFAALGVVAMVTAVGAFILLIVAASRAKDAKPKMPHLPDLMPRQAAASAPSSMSQPTTGAGAATASSFVDAITSDLTEKASAAANDALRNAADVVRKSPREAILAALAVAVVGGFVIGHRRNGEQ